MLTWWLSASVRGVQVVGCYQRALELNFSNAILLINLGEALESLHKYDQVGGTCGDSQSALVLLTHCSHGAHTLFLYTARATGTPLTRRWHTALVLLTHHSHAAGTPLLRCWHTALTLLVPLSRCCYTALATDAPLSE